MRCTTKFAGLAALLVAACQGPDEYFRGPLDAGGFDGPPLAGQGGTATGIGGSGPGAGGMPTGLGGAGPGAAGNVGTGTGGGAGSGSSGSTGSGGSGGTSTGAGGTNTGRGGTTGSGGAAGGRGGSTGAGGSAGATGTAGRGGATGAAGNTGAAGTTGIAGRGGTTGSAGAAGVAGNTGAAGTTGTGGRGGTTGSAGATGTGGGTGTVLYADDFESDAAGATTATGWTRNGGSSGDWTIATDGTKVLQQDGSASSTVRTQSLTGASAAGSPWSGAVSVSARVKMIATGSNNQAALLCVRYNDISNRYCGALVPGGVQILTVVGGTAAGSTVFAASVTTGTFYDLRVSVDASNVLTVSLGGTPRGTYPPASMTNGTVAVGTASMTAAFDDISVTRP